MTAVDSPRALRRGTMTILLTVVGVLLAFNLPTARGSEPLAQQRSARTAVGIAVCPHPLGNAPNVYRIWADGRVEYSTGTDLRREPSKRFPD